MRCILFFFQAEDGIRDLTVTGVQTCALPISSLEQPREPGPDPAGRSAASRRTPPLKVEVRLFASFLTYLPAPDPQGAVTLDVPKGSTVDDVARRLRIPSDLARVVLVNGQDAEPGRPLAAGDVIAVFPPLAGGRRS